MTVSRDAVMDVIYGSCLLLDEERYDDWLDGYCHPDFRYTITAYSTEIRKRMTWLDHGSESLRALCAMIPEQVAYRGRFHRHATLYRLALAEGGGTVESVSSLVVVHTDLEGESRFYAAGRYNDVLDLSRAAPRLLARNVDLDTRVLEFGSHRPL